ncbi:peptide ABC transporter ATP-binding protein [Chromatiales bacterium (ex Bugula neritina AB1)]|nr:peptide ABC transporter ATP-binding protein [Chromatiales bacterium (ex Bugula neritina AB1)]
MVSTVDSILQIKNLKTHFPVKSGVFNRVVGQVRAVDGIDLNVHRGEVLGLVGESGCGKTTLGKSILQLVQPTSGSVHYRSASDSLESSAESGVPVDFIDLCALTTRELMPYRQKLQIVFQDPHSSLNPAFTIFGSLEDPLRQCGISTRAERRKRVGDLLEAVNLRREYMDRYPTEFSGGQRQRIGIARALSVNPELIVCDEAVSALDVSIQAQVLQLLKDLRRERNLTYLFITHDLSVSEYICDRVAVMYLGKIVELGDAETLYRNPQHPYTRALLSAIPVADLKRKTRRIVLKGDVPSPVNPPSGCTFHPRCPEAVERCKTEAPSLRTNVQNRHPHSVACHLIDCSALQSESKLPRNN